MVQMTYRWDNTALHPVQDKQGYNKKQASTHTHINEKTSS